jgi:hypothetical protein
MFSPNIPYEGFAELMLKYILMSYLLSSAQSE